MKYFKSETKQPREPQCSGKTRLGALRRSLWWWLVPCWLETCRIRSGSDGIAELERTQMLFAFLYFVVVQLLSQVWLCYPMEYSPPESGGLSSTIFLCLPLSPGVWSNWCLLSRWCYPIFYHWEIWVQIGWVVYLGIKPEAGGTRPLNHLEASAGVTMQEPCCQSALLIQRCFCILTNWIQLVF